MGMANGGVKKKQLRGVEALVCTWPRLLAFACVWLRFRLCFCLRLSAFGLRLSSLAHICSRPPLSRPPLCDTDCCWLPLDDGKVEKSAFHGRYHFGTWEVEVGHSKVVVS